MATVNLEILRGEVYDRLGDSTNENIVASTVVDSQINEALTFLVGEAERVGTLVIQDSAVISVAANTDRIDLDTYLVEFDGVNWKASVRVASTTAVTLSSAFENGDTIDGVVLVTGDRILVKDQSSGSENGIYTVNASGAPTRATDADTDAEVVSGIAAFVTEGTANRNTGWVLTTLNPIVVDTTSLTFAEKDPNFRGNLFVLRTDQNDPVPVYWPDGGEFRVRELYRNAFRGYHNFPLTDGTGTVLSAPTGLIGPMMYRFDDRTIGFVKPPTSILELTIYYTPVLPLLTTNAATDSLEKIDLTFFAAWKNLVSLTAAEVIASDNNLSSYVTIERRKEKELRRFLTSIRRVRSTTRHKRLRSRWD